ncbi:MAG: hypothetical protein EOO43_05765 [Flavobacterium sp.]|nr:MAG: hypothetical protein EOO43_05765 [Flavobacterium sp.]
MKTLNASYQNLANHAMHSNASASITNLIHNTMKKLTSVSPFLLLLVPVFVMMVLSFTMNTTAQREEAALKSTSQNVSTISVSSKLAK